MASVTEVGASKIEVESYKCSIKKISASTEWENTDGKTEMVTTTVFDKNAKNGKTIYVISSPKGKEVTIKTEREDGQCQRENHKQYGRSWVDYQIDETKDVTLASRLPSNKLTSKIVALKLPVYPYSLNGNSQKETSEIKQVESFDIKCFEIGGALEALKYWKLPIPLDKKCTTQFSQRSCKEGAFNYQIISYPDICFYLEFSIGTDEAKKKKNGRSHFVRQTKSEKYLPKRAKALFEEAPGVEMKILPPSIIASTTYNGGDDELEVKLDFDDDNELFHFKYKHDSLETEFGSELLQEIPGTIKKFKELKRLIKKFYDTKKNFKELGIDLVKNYKPYTIKLNPPSITLSVDGKYQTSRDLTKIGKFYDICFACEPLISVSLTIDLLYIILTGLSAGTATGIYLMLKNLDKVISKLLGAYWKKKYKATKPFECDIYFDLVVTGAINGNVHWLIDTTEERGADSTKGSIEGVLKVDLKAGVKASVNVLYFISAGGEVSASGSSGIKFILGCENRILQGEGLILPYETRFLGLTIKYCVKGSIGFFRTYSFGGGIEGETTLLDSRPIKWLSGKAVFFEEKTGSNGKGSVGRGGGGGGGGGW